MLYVPAALQTHLEGIEITPALCLKLTLRTGAILAFTTHDAPLTVDAQVYLAAGAFSVSALRWTNRIEDQHTTIDGLVDSIANTITAEDIRLGILNQADYELFLVNWADVSNGKAHLKRGKLSSITKIGDRYEADLRNLFSPLLKKPATRVCGADCSWELGDTRCAFSRQSASSTVTNYNSPSEFEVGSLSLWGGADPTHVIGGEFRFTTGPFTWFRNIVKTYDEGTALITFVRPFPVYDDYMYAFTVFEGCDKKFSTCRDRFVNIEHFGGFPHVPVKDKFFKNTNAANPDGSAYAVGDAGND